MTFEALRGLSETIRPRSGADEASDQMLQLQINSLELRFRTLAATASAENMEIRDQLAGVFGMRPLKTGETGQIGQGTPYATRPPRKFTWDDAYKLESEIALLLEGDRLRQEIVGQLRFAASERIPEAASLQAEHAALLQAIEAKAVTETDNVLRAFLLQVLEAVHWHSKRKYLARRVRMQATRNTLYVGLAVLVALLWPYLVLRPAPQNAQAGVAMVASIVPVQAAAPNPAAAVQSVWSHFALYTALTCGLLGALFSRLITLQTQWSAMVLDELYNARAFHYILLRASIGMCGALIVFFFLQSGLVEGSVFPKFDQLELEQLMLGSNLFNSPVLLVLPSADLALLIVWSFLAGFSESLVPSVLSSTERQFTGAVNRNGAAPSP